MTGTPKRCRTPMPTSTRFGPADVVEFFREYYGPATRAFATLGEAEQTALRAELVQLWSAHNTASVGGRTTVDAEYLEVVATRA
jgi:hypothetical protein